MTTPSCFVVATTCIARRSSASLSEEALPLLLIELKDITNWHLLGMNLGVRKSKLDAIQAQHLLSHGLDRCKGEALSVWLRGNAKASWKELVDALRQMDEQALATTLEAKYPQPVTAIQNDGNKGSRRGRGGGLGWQEVMTHSQTSGSAGTTHI